MIILQDTSPVKIWVKFCTPCVVHLHRLLPYHTIPYHAIPWGMKKMLERLGWTVKKNQTVVEGCVNKIFLDAVRQV